MTSDDEPLNDGDPFNCYFNYDASGNNTVDFGFFDPDVTSVKETTQASPRIQIFPNPANEELTIKADLSSYELEIFDLAGVLRHRIQSISSSESIDISSLPVGLYILKVKDSANNTLEIHKLIKH